MWTKITEISVTVKRVIMLSYDINVNIFLWWMMCLVNKFLLFVTLLCLNYLHKKSVMKDLHNKTASCLNFKQACYIVIAREPKPMP